MPLAALLSLLSPSSSQPTKVRRKRPTQERRTQPQRICKITSKPDSQQNPSQFDSVDLGSTISPSQLECAVGNCQNIVIDTQPIVQGNDSINLSTSEISVVPETQDPPSPDIGQSVIKETQDPPTPVSPMQNLSMISQNSTMSPQWQSTPHNKRSIDMMSNLSHILSDSDIANSMLPMTPSFISPGQNACLSNSAQYSLNESQCPSPPLVTSSQLPESQTLEEKYDGIVRQLICANARIAKLEAENKQLKDDIKVQAIRSAAGIFDDNLTSTRKLSHQSVQTESTVNSDKQTCVSEPPKNHTETLLFRSNGNLSVLSNFHSVTLHIDGHRYASAEHAYHHKMASFHSRSDIANKILHAGTA